MSWLKMFQKGGMGFLTNLFSAGAALVIANPSLITNLIPEKWGTMTLAGVAGFIAVALANWIKNKNVPSGMPQK